MRKEKAKKKKAKDREGEKNEGTTSLYSSLKIVNQVPG